MIDLWQVSYGLEENSSWDLAYPSPHTNGMTVYARADHVRGKIFTKGRRGHVR